MTDISDAAKAKAAELAHASSYAERGCHSGGLNERNVCALDTGHALARFIQQVSDAAKEAKAHGWDFYPALTKLETFILPEPVDPTKAKLKLAIHALGEAGAFTVDRSYASFIEAAVDSDAAAFVERTADELLDELAKRGLKIVAGDA